MTSRLGSRDGAHSEGSAIQKGRHPVSRKATHSQWCHLCWGSMDAPSVALNSAFILPAREPAGHEVVANSPFRLKIFFLIVLRNNLNDQDHLKPFSSPVSGHGWWHKPSMYATHPFPSCIHSRYNSSITAHFPARPS